MSLDTSKETNQVLKRDTLFHGELLCDQHEDGYRYSIDAVLLAHFVEVKKCHRILDLGTGSGIIALILLYLHRNLLAECSGLELQSSLYRLATHNIALNGFSGLNTLYHCDVKEIRKCLQAGTYDSVVCNPPFYPESTGRINAGQEARVARHQIAATLSDFLSAAAFAVRNRGEVYCIYPAELLSDFILQATTQKLTVKAARFIYSYPESDKGARLVLIKCRKNGGSGLEIKSPLYIYTKKNGAYSAEVESYYRPPGNHTTCNLQS